MTDRVPGNPGQYTASLTAAQLQKLLAGEEFTIVLIRNDNPITEGTPYSKEAVLPDALAADLCPDTQDPTPAQALQALTQRLASNTESLSGGISTAQSTAEAAQSTANTAVSNAATAQSTANTAVSNAATAQTAATNANNNANTKMPIAGGTFTGNVAAINTNRTGNCVRNIYVNGVNTNYILMVRK